MLHPGLNITAFEIKGVSIDFIARYTKFAKRDNPNPPPTSANRFKLVTNIEAIILSRNNEISTTLLSLISRFDCVSLLRG